MSLDSWQVSTDEKDAIALVSTLVRAIRKWPADYRIQKRANQAEKWLNRYDAKHPFRMLRDGAVLSDGESSENSQ